MGQLASRVTLGDGQEPFQNWAPWNAHRTGRPARQAHHRHPAREEGNWTTTGSVNRTTNAASCGYDRDCPPMYELGEVNISAASWHRSSPMSDVEVRRARNLGQRACTPEAGFKRLPWGAWCFGANNGRLDRNGKRRPLWVELPRNMSYALPWGLMPPPNAFVDVLLTHPSTRRASINDFGAGVGMLGRALLSREPNTLWRGYDGAGDVETYTDGFVGFGDLSLELTFPRADWVLAMQVGQLVPVEYELLVLRNLHAHNLCGLVYQWAGLGSSGIGHVNNHSPKYLQAIFFGLGYVPYESLQRALRRKSQLNVHAWRRITPLPGCSYKFHKATRKSHHHGKANKTKKTSPISNNRKHASNNAKAKKQKKHKTAENALENAPPLLG